MQELTGFGSHGVMVTYFPVCVNTRCAEIVNFQMNNSTSRLRERTERTGESCLEGVRHQSLVKAMDACLVHPSFH